MGAIIIKPNQTKFDEGFNLKTFRTFNYPLDAFVFINLVPDAKSE